MISFVWKEGERSDQVKPWFMQTWKTILNCAVILVLISSWPRRSVRWNCIISVGEMMERRNGDVKAGARVGSQADGAPGWRGVCARENRASVLCVGWKLTSGARKFLCERWRWDWDVGRVEDEIKKKKKIKALICFRLTREMMLNSVSGPPFALGLKWQNWGKGWC